MIKLIVTILKMYKEAIMEYERAKFYMVLLLNSFLAFLLLALFVLSYLGLVFLFKETHLAYPEAVSLILMITTFIFIYTTMRREKNAKEKKISKADRVIIVSIIVAIVLFLLFVYLVTIGKVILNF